MSQRQLLDYFEIFKISFLEYAYQKSFHERIKSIQHNAEVTITAAVRDIKS